MFQIFFLPHSWGSLFWESKILTSHKQVLGTRGVRPKEFMAQGVRDSWSMAQLRISWGVQGLGVLLGVFVFVL